MDIKEIVNLSPEQISKLIDAGDISESIILTIPLDTAFVNKQYDIAGNYIACFNSTDVNTNVDIEFNRINSGAINFTQGLKFRRPFNRIFITSSAQAGKTIQLLISSFNPLFELQDDRSNNLTASYLAEIQEQLQGGTTLTNAADATVTTSSGSVLASNTDRHALMLFADLANTAVIYVGNSSVSATRKMVALNPGDSLLLDDYTGQLYAVSASGSQKLSVAEW